MPNHEPNFITAIDVGSAKTSVLVAELSDNGLRYRGHGIGESRGLRKGVIAELDKATSSIQKAVERAEDVAGIAIEHALIGIAGAHIRGINSHGGIGFGARSREIGREEIRQAVDKARAIPLPGDREILHLLPQEFILDGQPGVHDPTGMMCTRLEVRLHIVTAASNATQNLVTAVNRAGVQVDDTIFEPLACADSVLRPEERELGVCLADLGAGSCDLIVFQQGAVAHTAVIPVGGDHFTSDLSVGMCTGLADAEMLKKNFGNAVPTLIPEGNEVEVPCGGRPAVAHDAATRDGRDSGAARSRTFRVGTRQPAPCGRVWSTASPDSCSAAERRGCPGSSTWRNRCCAKRRVWPGQCRWRRCRRSWRSRSSRPCWEWPTTAIAPVWPVACRRRVLVRE